MTPHDQQRLADFIDRFIAGCDEIAPPFHMVCIASNGSIAITLHTDADVKEICNHRVEPGFVTPLTLTIITPDGGGRSARVAIEEARGTMPRDDAMISARSRPDACRSSSG